MKRFPYLIVFFLGLAILISSSNIQAGSKGINILNSLGNQVKSLKDNKAYGKKKLLLIVGNQRKSTTVENFLNAVNSVLSETQYHIFTLPLVMSSIQNLPVANVTVSGTVITDLKLGNKVAPDNAGLAEIFIIYDGNMALPNQVLANVKIE